MTAGVHFHSKRMNEQTDNPHLHLFEGYGIELEYMLVDADTLAVHPVADAVLRDEANAIVSEIEHGAIAWSNELVAHVIELKTNGPAKSLDGLADQFQSHVTEINERLRHLNARLMPTGMHPWMDPDREMVLWPHEYSRVYEAYHRIFNCRGHGWANLQSMHINLPFCGDEEFARLHAAIRLVLPLLPGLAASSPCRDGQFTGLADTRLEVYRHNADSIPSVTGRVIPEPVYSEADYHREIFEPMWADIAHLDRDRVLRDEFLNSRGAIARFGRGTIEIRVIDVQECPQADLAIAALTCEVLKALIAERWTPLNEQQSVAIDPLERVFLAAIAEGDQAVIDDPGYLRQFGIGDASLPLTEVWRRLHETVEGARQNWRPPIETILQGGSLSQRIRKAHEAGATAPDAAVYRAMCEDLAAGRMFLPPADLR